MIILHHLNNSRSQRILWLLEELGIPYEVKRYERKADKLAPKELFDVHPLGKSPVITDTARGNKVVAESGHIINYLIRHYGNGRFLPQDAEIDENDFWVQFCEGSLMPSLVFAFVLKVIPTQAPFFARPLVSYIMSQVNARFTGPDLQRKVPFVAAALERRAADGRAWFAGGDKNGEPTAADFQMLFAIEAFTSPVFDQSLVPESLRNWVNMVHKRPAYIRAYEKGGAYDYAKL